MVELKNIRKIGMSMASWTEKFQPIVDTETNRPINYNPNVIQNDAEDMAFLDKAIKENRVWTYILPSKNPNPDPSKGKFKKRQKAIIVNDFRLKDRKQVFITKIPFDIELDYTIYTV